MSPNIVALTHDWISSAWRTCSGQSDDKTDSKEIHSAKHNNSRHLIDRILVKWKEIAEWQDVNYSLTWGCGLHVAYFIVYISFLRHPVTVVAFASITLLVYSKWYSDIWPEICVDSTASTTKAAIPCNCSDIDDLVSNVERTLLQIWHIMCSLRHQNKLAFCIVGSIIFSVTAYVGAFISLSVTVYTAFLCSLTCPALLVRAREARLTREAMHRVSNGRDSVDGKVGPSGASHVANELLVEILAKTFSLWNNSLILAEEWHKHQCTPLADNNEPVIRFDLTIETPVVASHADESDCIETSHVDVQDTQLETTAAESIGYASGETSSVLDDSSTNCDLNLEVEKKVVVNCDVFTTVDLHDTPDTTSVSSTDDDSRTASPRPPEETDDEQDEIARRNVEISLQQAMADIEPVNVVTRRRLDVADEDVASTSSGSDSYEVLPGPDGSDYS